MSWHDQDPIDLSPLHDCAVYEFVWIGPELPGSRLSRHSLRVRIPNRGGDPDCTSDTIAKIASDVYWRVGQRFPEPDDGVLFVYRYGAFARETTRVAREHFKPRERAEHGREGE